MNMQKEKDDFLVGFIFVGEYEDWKIVHIGMMISLDFNGGFSWDLLWMLAKSGTR